MNKFIKFNSILFSSAIFLLNPIFGMEQKTSPKSFPHWTTGIDDYNDNTSNNDKSYSASEKSELEKDRSAVEKDEGYYKNHAPENDSSASDDEISDDESSSADSDSYTSASESDDDSTLYQTPIALNNNPHQLSQICSPRNYGCSVKTSNLAVNGQRPIEKSLEKIGLSIKSGDMKAIDKLKKFIEREYDRKIVKEILNKKIGTEKYTLLHYIIIFLENPKKINDLINLFIRHGADPEAKDAFGKSALDYALDLAEDLNKKTNEVVTNLKKHIADKKNNTQKLKLEVLWTNLLNLILYFFRQQSFY